VLPAVLNDLDCRAKCVRFEVADAALETLQYSDLSAVLVRMRIRMQVDAARDQQIRVPQERHIPAVRLIANPTEGSAVFEPILLPARG
jgi:hypothetical protein